MRSMRKAVNIPKETKGKMRPLGISCYEDKLVENAIAQILEQIYEPKFYDESFGFRPNRSCHQAVREIIEMVQYRKTNYVVEAENVISYDTEMTLYAVSRTNMRRKYSNKGWKNALGSMGWNWQRKRRGEGKPNTFDFLGFTFYCGMDGRKQFYRCRVKTSRKKFRRKIKAMKEWIKRNRTKLLEWLFKMVNAKLRGHYQYYGVTDNTKEEKNFLNRTRSLLFKWLNRRSQKRSYTWETFNNGLLRTFPLLEPRVKVSLFYR